MRPRPHPVSVLQQVRPLVIRVLECQKTVFWLEVIDLSVGVDLRNSSEFTVVNNFIATFSGFFSLPKISIEVRLH